MLKRGRAGLGGMPRLNSFFTRGDDVVTSLHFLYHLIIVKILITHNTIFLLFFELFSFLSNYRAWLTLNSFICWTSNEPLRPQKTLLLPAVQINHLQHWQNIAFVHAYVRVPGLEDEEQPLFRCCDVTFSTELSGADKLAWKPAC